MKAVVFHESGGVEKLQYEEVPDPEPMPGEVVVKVRACALNHLDIWSRTRVPTSAEPMPHISGSDVSGEVAKIGEGVTGLTEGMKVLINPGISCGRCEFCIRGMDSVCRQYRIFGSKTQGGYAEYVKAPAENVLPMPNNLSFEEAAAIPLVYLTAWHMLTTRAGMKPGESVLVIGAGSGVGSAGIQIAKLLRGYVIATAGSDDKLQKAKGIGADAVINHTVQDVAAEVRKLTGDKGVDIVFEHVGSAIWEKCILSLARGGRLVTCGATTGNQGATNISLLMTRHLNILGSFMGSRAELLEVMKFVERGELKAVVDSTFPLRDAAKAQQRMEERGHFGKIVLTVP